MNNRNAGLAVGAFFVLLALGKAMGAVSPGAYRESAVSGSASGSYPVYNPCLEVAAPLLTAMAVCFF